MPVQRRERDRLTAHNAKGLLRFCSDYYKYAQWIDRHRRHRSKAMSLKFHSEAERKRVARLHAEVYRRTRHGWITVDEALRLSKALVEPHMARRSVLKKGS